MSKKTVETMKTPDGRFVWEIGEVDDMGGGFGCLFVDKVSGKWTRTNGPKIEYTGQFFPTRESAMAAGKEELSKWVLS